MSARSFRSRGSALSAVLTGRAAKAIKPIDAHERNVLAITRRIHTAQGRLRSLAAEAKRLRQQLRADRRELRSVLQRDSSIDVATDRPAAARLALAGHADAIDAVNAQQERRQR